MDFNYITNIEVKYPLGWAATSITPAERPESGTKPIV